jgi:predicted DNA-binding WGR domain protein
VITGPNLNKSPERVASFRAYARFVSVDPERNRYRFYSLTWQPILWGGGVLLRCWGRIGTRGRSSEVFYQDRSNAQQLVEHIIKRRLQRGYQVVDVC